LRVQRSTRRFEFFEIAALFFLQWMAFAAWMLPLTLVLKTHGLEKIQPFAFATSATAAFVTPLFFGAVADRHAGPTRVLRWLALATAAAMSLTCVAIQSGWNAWLVLALIQLHALCSSPTVSISTAIAMSAMQNPRREFGPIRGVGTIGWMAGCWLVSALNADASTRAGFSAAAIWLGLAAFTFLLPSVKPPETTGRLSWHERLGLDALTLLKKPDHRVVFLTTTLLAIPMAAFYPFAPLHLRELGFARPSAWMSLAQTTEIITMFTLGALLMRWRLKWIVAAGIIFAVLRFAFSAVNGKWWLLAGIVLHGCNYAFVYITAQIYVNERVAATWRTRAQALLTLLNSGVGNLAGYLSTGWWFSRCTENENTRWPIFWGGLSAASGAVLIYFLAAYHGRGISPRAAVSLADERE
jgi:nucleoside transporter